MNSKSFPGGITPPEYKELTENYPFETVPYPEDIILPLSQHLGKEAVIQVKKGDEVFAGQLIAKAEGYVSASIHSPAAGKVVSIGKEITSTGFPKDAI